jgi:hypothetical protein
MIGRGELCSPRFFCALDMPRLCGGETLWWRKSQSLSESNGWPRAGFEGSLSHSSRRDEQKLDTRQ